MAAIAQSRGSLLLNLLRGAGRRYASFSEARPHATAGLTAAGIMGAADVSCQLLLQSSPDGGIDWRRTAGLTLFGLLHYGGPCKALYLLYDRRIGAAQTLSVATKKMIFDVYVHSPFLLVPHFYFLTGVVKGKSVQQCATQLRDEWFEASFGTALVCLLNFLFVPQHSRIAFVAAVSFCHKLWMSWLSNRRDHAETLAQQQQQQQQVVEQGVRPAPLRVPLVASVPAAPA